MSAPRLDFPDTYLTFRIGALDYGVEAGSLWEISNSSPFSHIPRTDSFLVGVTHLHGKIIPVIDLPSLLELKLPAKVDRPTFIALQAPPLGHLGGFYMTRVLGFEKFPPRFTKPPRNTRPFVTGEVERTQGFCSLLDLEKLWRSIKPTPLALQTVG
jgi:chemotaxis signal transduction protein